MYNKVLLLKGKENTVLLNKGQFYIGLDSPTDFIYIKDLPHRFLKWRFEVIREVEINHFIRLGVE